jgi:hypothetical protein
VSDDDDRRSQPRVGFKVPAHILVGPEERLYKGFVLNISENGAFIMMDQGVAIGPGLSMGFTIPPGTDCHASGRIVHSMEMGAFQGLGVELTQCNDAWINFLRNLAAASPGDLLFYVKDMKRIIVRA